MSLKLALDLALPAEAATQTFLVVGKRGSGKSNTAVRLAEQLYHAGVPWVAIDPVDNWHGVKSSRDGKGPGLSVYVFGGPHGDLPLESTAGALVADTIVDHRITAVLSVKHFSVRERGRFVGDFAQRLFQRNKEPLHLFLEEAHEVAPQNPYKGEEEMLGHVTRIWKLGRSSGLGGSAITQRPASLSKNITTQAEILIVHRTLGPQDVAAIREWIKYHGEREEILGQLSTLKTGEAFVWAPDFPEGRPIGLKRVIVNQRETFDSAATPKAGERRVEPKALAAVDLDKLSAKMAATIEKAKADDPRALRAEVARLNTELHKKPSVSTQAPKTIEKRVLKDQDHRRLEVVIKEARQVLTRLEKLRELLRRDAETVSKVAVSFYERSVGLEKTIRDAIAPPAPTVTHPVTLAPRPITRPVRTVPAPVLAGDTKLDKAEQAVVAVLAQHPDGCLKGTLALLAGYRWSGGFRNVLSALRTKGLLDGANSGVMRLTDAGVAVAGDVPALPSGRELLAYWLVHPSLGLAERRTLEQLVQHPKGLAAAQLAEVTGYEWSGGYRNALSNLRTAGLLLGRNSEVMRAAEEFFA